MGWPKVTFGLVAERPNERVTWAFAGAISANPMPLAKIVPRIQDLMMISSSRGNRCVGLILSSLIIVFITHVAYQTWGNRLANRSMPADRYPKLSRSLLFRAIARR